MEHTAFANDGVDEVGVTVELVLYDVVENLEEEENEVVVGGTRVQKPRSAERLIREEVSKMTWELLSLFTPLYFEQV